MSTPTAIERDSCAFIGRGDTESDAIADLADLMGVPLWNEEEFANHQAQKRDSKTHE